MGEGLTTFEDGSLADFVQLGDFFAVKAESRNQWDADFYILQCEEPLHIVSKSFTDSFGETFAVGDSALRGLWYQQVPGKDLKFVLGDNVDNSYYHAASIVHIRFGMTPCEVGKGRSGGARMYLLHEDTLSAIMESLEY